MKLKTCILYIAFLLSVTFANGQQEQYDVLLRKISIQSQDQPVSFVLDSITKLTGFYFSYDPISIDANRKINISFSRTPIEKVLNTIFSSNCKYLVLRDQIIITRKNESQETIEEDKEETTSEKQLVVYGRLFDQDDKSPIPYASISLTRKPIGTISNQDGAFELKLGTNELNDTLSFSCLGFQKFYLPVSNFDSTKNDFYLRPAMIRIKEIKVHAINAEEIIRKLVNNIQKNYLQKTSIMTTFYRETLKQDDKYINISEAVMEVLKFPYNAQMRDDQTKLLKGRKSPNVMPFKDVDFKMMGGPYYITKLDVLKTMETFLDPEYRDLYKYELEQVINYDDRPTYVVKFRPSSRISYPSYQGKLYIDQETFALISADFGLSRIGLKNAHETMIRKKPKDLYVRPIQVKYQVSYKNNGEKWMLNTAQINVMFKVKSKNDRINSVFHSRADLLVTNCKDADVRRFKNSETFRSNDILTELIIDYDQDFWGKYNIIKPSEDLRNALNTQEKPQGKAGN